MKPKTLFKILSVMLALSFASTVTANHLWGSYHWARTANPFSLKLGDNVSFSWDAALATASSDWTQSSALDTSVVATLSNKNCRAVSGRVEVCNKTYGNNGWLGLAQIWINSAGHITQGVAKMNDTYFNTAPYNTLAWKQFVMCQEVGHTLGLDHQDEDFDNPNLGTCMDYTSNPASNQHPNAHDYEQLALIYTHLDSSTTVRSSISKNNGGKINAEDSDEWGKAIRKDKNGKPSLYEKDLGKGQKLFTFVIWTE
ncbi:MAG: hypothetical protein AAB861_02615 [Patescibacteria group bacterium]